MQNITIGESICLSSEDFETEQPPEQTTNSRFEQKGRLFRYQAEYRVYNDHFIEVKTAGVFERPRTYQLDCTFLDRHAKRVLNIDWCSAAAFVFLLSSAVVLAWMAPSLEISAVVLGASLASALAAAALTLLVCLRRSSDSIVFYSRHGRVPLLRLRNHNPSTTELKAFVGDIGKRIKRARQGWNNREQFLSAELREHRRLKDEGILTPERYETVKRRILGKHA